MRNGLLKLRSNDFVKGAVTAVGAAIFIMLYNLINQVGFDVFAVDWNAIFRQVVNGGVAAFAGYIFKNFFSTDRGSFLNITPEDKPKVE